MLKLLTIAVLIIGWKLSSLQPFGIESLTGWPLELLNLEVLFARPSGYTGLYENIANYNDENCIVRDGIGSSEDMAVDYESNTIYLGSGSAAYRKQWFPAANHHNFDGKLHQDSIYLYDIENDEFTELILENYEKNLILHGMSMVVENDGSRLLYFVNHQPTASVISVFEHTLGTTSLKHLYDATSSLIHTPNVVSAINRTSFYITNDHLFKKGFGRTIEDNYGPWAWSSVAYCSVENGQTDCQIKARGISYANGLLYIADSKQLVVTDSRIGQVRIFDVSSNGDLKLVRTVNTGTFLDNVSKLPNNDLVIAVIPEIGPFWQKANDPLNSALSAPIAAIRLPSSTNYTEPQLIMRSDGKHFSGVTSVSMISGNLYAGSVINDGLLICSVS